MTPVVTIRPEPGCSATAAAAKDFGLKISCFPLSHVVPVEWKMPDGPFDGILAGSANAFRLGGLAVDTLVDKPVYAVGKKTAAAAWTRGLRTAVIGSGGLQTVLDGLTGQSLRLLRVAGEDHVELDPPEGIEVVTVVAYRSENLPMPPELHEMLAHDLVVLLHSAVAAQHFASEVDRVGAARGGIRIAALGPRIAAAAGEGWAQLRSAAEPSDAALLALARDLCHEPFTG